MSSRILSGPATGKAKPILWKKLGSGGGEPWSPTTGDTANTGPAPAESVAALGVRIQQLETEISTREQQAHEAGFQEGEQRAREQLEGPLREAMSRLTAQLEELAGLRRKLRREAEQDLVRLAIAIARRILHRQLLADPEAILGIVKASLDRVDAREILRIRVHPEDAAMLRDLLAARGLPAGVEVAADPGLERGGFLIDTSRGTLDASIATQLQEIEHGLTDLVRSSHP